MHAPRRKFVIGGGPSRRTLAVSLALHAALLVVVLLAPAETLPQRVRPRDVDVVFHRPRPRPIDAAPPRVVPPPPPRPVVERELPKPAPPPPQKPIPTPPPRPAPTPPPIARREPTPPPKAPPQEPARPVVRTNVFGAEPAPAAVKPAAAAPRTGAFGAATTAADASLRRERPVASAGFSAAAPASAPETVQPRERAPVKAGFDGAAVPASVPERKPAASATVRQGQFGDTVVVHETKPARERPAGKPDTPVEILSKPKPSYTEEARRLKIEGEVVLEVVFVSTGQLRVLGVLQALGHGLDEAAIEAARSIEFKPARRDGKPIDHAARLHILFQLA